MTSDSFYKLSTLSGIAIVMANMIGTGAFTSLGIQLKELQDPIAVLALWIFGGLYAISGAFSYAEVGTAIRRSGGEYTFLSEIYHPVVGYLSGWISLTVGFAAPIALTSIAFTAYFQPIGICSKCLAVLILAGITFIHSKSLLTSSRFQLISTLFKVIVIIVIISAGLALSPNSNKAVDITSNFFTDLKSGAFAIALIYVSYSYSGWNAATYISEEFKHPRKSIPLALVGGTIIVTVFYTLLQFVFLKHTPISELAGQIEVGEIAASKIFGEKTGKMVGTVIALLLVSSLSSMVWVGPRVTSTMARKHLIWRYFKTNSGEIPKRALWLQFGISCLLIVTGTFEQLMIYCGVLLTVSTMLVVWSVFKLRTIEKHSSKDTYRSPLFPFFQLLYLLLSIWMIAYALVSHPYETMIGLLNLFFGIISYYFSTRMTKKTTDTIH